MKTTNDPKAFLASLSEPKNPIFDNGKLRAEVSHVKDENSKREIFIRYFEWVGGKWQAFSFCCSPFNSHIIDDFMQECKVFSIYN